MGQGVFHFPTPRQLSQGGVELQDFGFMGGGGRIEGFRARSARKWDFHSPLLGYFLPTTSLNWVSDLSGS